MTKLANIEFDSPFTVFEGGNVIAPIGIYAPIVEHCEQIDYTINGYAENSDWEKFSVGYTGQYGYNGAVMHASETLSGRLAEDILSTPGTYVVCTVEVNCDDGECYMSCDDLEHDSDAKELRMTHGCDCEPAGWTVLRMKD